MEIEIANIQVASDRQRQEEDEVALAELVESIKNNGLINPIVIDRNNKLIAGGRRLTAHIRLGRQTIEARYFDSLDLLTQKIIEFDENDKRKQLTWQETARAIEEIHRLQVAQSAETGKAWSGRDTARVLGLGVGRVAEDLQLAASLGNERIAGRPTRRGAIDTFKRERELTVIRELARRRATSMGLSADAKATSFLTGIITNDDCRTALANIADESVDLIVTDPPWGIDWDKSTQWTTKWIATYSDDQESVHALLREVFPHLFRVLKPASHLYIFFPIQEIEWWVRSLTECGFVVRQRPLIWYKSGQPGISDVYTSFLPTYETILWGYKPAEGNVRRLFSHPVPDAQAWPRPAHLWHENEKPVEMLDKWVETSSEINEVVLDPFCGGASTLASCFGLGRYFIGFEKELLNYTKACERMKQLEERKEDETDASQG